MPHFRPTCRDGFTIAIICALPREAAAVEAVLDEVYDKSGGIYGKDADDPNEYTFGRIDKHNLVIVHMSGMGKLNAALASGYLKWSFPHIKLGLVVGVCGGVPQGKLRKYIFLGDVIVSDGMIEYDLEAPFRQYELHGDMDSCFRPVQRDVAGLTWMLRIGERHLRLEKELARHLAIAQCVSGMEESRHPGVDADELFQASYQHRHPGSFGCALCDEWGRTDGPGCFDAIQLSCQQLQCGQDVSHGSRKRSVVHGAGKNPSPSIHLGTIGSGDTVLMSGEDRDRLAAKTGAIGFEMEGAGVWGNVPCLVIKGVSDYSDSHKNKGWRLFPPLIIISACVVVAIITSQSLPDF
ncbi:purine and uridine phosphorylase [Aspergillus ellipticus CBS 707.79]|uniref:Purine and uridine phosphorylase n=1 Tax=Aspergillus ellipticus CBS 707.79 TaxID=1448320 RepID=A0A319D4Y5_9EURO|nr:purine and uridine phosphorylase [Aspergillus ellipticus CBS 707.79]